MKWMALIFASVLMVTGVTAEAKRLASGKSVGKQSSNVTQREAAASPAAPSNAVTNNTAKPAAAPAATPAAAPKKPWGAMLGGLAAGLGLAWLAHSLGMGEGFGQFLLIALAVLAVMVVIGMVMRSRRPAAAASAASGPFAFQGAGSSADPTVVRQYNPSQVGNDASARPWERNSMAFESSKYANGQSGGSGVQIGSALAGSQGWGVPPGFDAVGFLDAAKRNFVSLQDAWDRSDIPALRAMMTDDMLTEIRTQLADRESHTGVQPNKTEVVMLDANLLGIEDLGEGYMASVEFSGMIREEPSAGPSPFREVWNMTKPKSGSVGWLVAGVQALQ